MYQSFHKWAVALLLTTSCIFGAAAQERIAEAGISLTLPNEHWTANDKKQQDGVTAYYFKREALTDVNGAEVIPNIGIVIESVAAGTDAIAYSAEKRTMMPFEVDEVFAGKDKGMELTNAVGYKGRYEDQYGEHTVYVIHAIHKGKGITLICDVLSSLFPQLDDEFLSALFSVKVD